MEDDKSRKDQLQAVWFAAGMAVIIACLERATVLSIFKNWHMWVFLALNLLLIAILFTSKYPPRNTSNPSPKSHSGQESVKMPPLPAVVDYREDVVDHSENDKEECSFEENDDNDDDDKMSGLLSNDELNEKVEAFISRFRQQYLVSDVKISRTSSSDNVCRSAVFAKTITV